MPSIPFFLKEPKSKEETLIYLIYQYGGKRLKYSTGQKLLPKFWNSSNHRVKETKLFKDYGEFNALLDNIESCVNNTHRKLLNDGIEPTPDRLKVFLDELLQKNNTAEKNKQETLLEFIPQYIESSSKMFNTKKQYKTAYKQLLDYQIARKAPVCFDTIDLNFYDDFFKFLIERGYSNNSIGTIVKNVKVFMNEAVERGLTTNLQFKNKRFKVIEENTDAVYLTIEELKKILALDLTGNTRLDKVRDLFLIGCYTGLRFSDLIQLKDDNLIANGTQVKIRTAKTNEVVIIPLNSAVKSILTKYDGVPPQIISNQKMNAYLKELGQLAKLDNEVLMTSTKGGARKSESYKKHELVTVHTARRSFATNAYLGGVPTISIMKITGHRTEKSFMKYIKISQEDNANKLVNHPFFN
ncbi:MAG: site-specific integrase [Chitinophagaceae bacterium]|nr:site-specific integrase [Chitinophagaceae bacterium]MCA6454329.1 site-specific integrase [Chitinophagaceae bacterium]MCA6460102.1 site-specific integrase [Chitinophagaceae bacterium]MCA6463197.1 site-specific integrase [Chitinophagaceae bacterium]